MKRGSGPVGGVRLTIPLEEAEAIIAMRKAGATYRYLVKYFERSKWSIYRVLQGMGPHAVIDRDAILPDPDPDWPGKPMRCPGCGVKVRGDECCVICAARRARGEE